MVLEQPDKGKKKKRRNLNPYLTPHKKLIPRWITDVNLKSKIKSVEDNTEDYLHDLGDKQRSFRILKALTIKEENIDKLDLMKI